MSAKPLKLVISGPVGAGKTTFVQSLAEIPVVNTDELASNLEFTGDSDCDGAAAGIGKGV